jgi:hypothetical protein
MVAWLLISWKAFTVVVLTSVTSDQTRAEAQTKNKEWRLCNIEVAQLVPKMMRATIKREWLITTSKDNV